MAGLPTITVKLDDGTGTFPYDVSSYVRLTHGIEISRGRDDELSDASPGTLALTFDNTDGRFTLGSTTIASPSPIKVNTRIRVIETANAVTRNRFTGYVQQWPVEWPSGSDVFSTVEVQATDAQARAERRPLSSIIREEYLANSPLWYYPLSEPATATSYAGISGNAESTLVQLGSDANSAPVAFGSAAAPLGEGTAAEFTSGGKRLVTTYPLSSPAPNIISIAFRREGTPSVTEGILPDLTTGNQFVYFVTMTTAGKLDPLGGGGTVSAKSYNDGQWHHLCISGGSMYVDGVLVLNVGVAAQISDTPTAELAHHAGYAFGSLDATKIATQASAVLTGLSGESGTARITRLAGYAGLPLGTLEASQTNVSGAYISDQSLADAIRDAVQAEGGLFYVDGSGNGVFLNRFYVPSKTTPNYTVNANQLETSTAVGVDAANLLNYFAATAAGTGTEQVAVNTTSQTAHGRYSGSAEYEVTTDQEALDRANWIVATRSDPTPRIGSLTLDVLTLSAADQSTVLSLEPNSWLRVTGLPSQTPGGTTADLILQGFSESLSLSEWTITFNVTSRSPTGVAWILNDTTYSVLGTTTKLYF